MMSGVDLSDAAARGRTPRVASNVNKYFDATARGGAMRMENIAASMRSTKTTSHNDTNKPVKQNVIPKVWLAPYHYDRHVINGDLLFAVNNASERDLTTSGTMQERAVLTTSQMNHHMAIKRQQARDMLAAAIRSSGKHDGYQPVDGEIPYDVLYLRKEYIRRMLPLGTRNSIILNHDARRAEFVMLRSEELV